MKEKGSRKKKVTKSELEKALIKKVLGYDATEVIEEYSGGEDGEVKLLKKKVTVKNVPPDMTALKLLLDEKQMSVTEMTDEELEQERLRLLQLLEKLKNS